MDNVRVLSLVGATSAGFAIGYYVAQKRVAEKYFRMAEIEIESVKKMYKQLYKADEYVTVHSTAEELISGKEVLDRIVSENEYADSESNVVTVNIFNSTALSQEREDGVPYVISIEDFMQNENDFDQLCLSYYLGDDVLCDDQDKPIDDVANTVGQHNLKNFGVSSNDPNIVYVRNELLRVDFEVRRIEGTYASAVFGAPPDDEG